ncbi:class I SAM-dependent methyltransferase [Bradyrhizobium sp. SZCCHNS2096]|uniref:class I SAM-dependent methyltransferase n=1 Tax=Bradyrhizobium sp. SZCCHNS2096 TaxID=3057309 RepID=UPI002915F86A|nr:class I SAM-dependent methyltransferase [Bradyrhizobium sp. SZCCHNS2096]
MADHVSGTEGYAEEADDLFVRYETHRAEDLHRAVLHLIPKQPARVVDIGAGTGRDAAWLAGLGHQVVAVEPTDTLRLRAIALHPSPAITWIDDSLPELAALRSRAQAFDLVMLTAVFMHLDAEQRARAMPNIASQIAPGGRLIIRLRHGPVPPGRRMFEVASEEIIALAGAQKMTLVFDEHAGSQDARNQAAGVTWTTLGLMKAY